MRKMGLTSAKYLLILGLVAFAVGCDLDFGDCGKMKSHRTEQLSASITEGATLSARIEVGSIVVSGADVTDCNVTAKITAKAHTQAEADKLAQAVKIKLEPEDGGLKCWLEKPENMPKCSVEADLEITVPAKLSLKLESNVGEIKVSNITGAIRAVTNVGGISCNEVEGDVELEVNVGNVTAQYRQSAESTFTAKLQTNVGNAVFIGPAELSAKVNASTNIGSIDTKHPLTVTGKFLEHSVHGTIGEGTATLFMKADVGSVEIK